MTESVGERLRQVRGALSQGEFGEQLGVAKDTIGKYERNQIIPGGDVLARLRRLFGTDLNWLLSGEAAADTGSAIMGQADFYGRVLETVGEIYREMGWPVPLRRMGAEAARIAGDLLVEGEGPEGANVAVKVAAALLRRHLGREEDGGQ